MPDQNSSNTNSTSSTLVNTDPARDPEFVKKVAERVYELLVEELRLEHERRGKKSG